MLSEEIVIARAWCKECLRDCFQAYNETTGRHTHLGPETTDLVTYTDELKTKGFQYGGHHSGTWKYYRRVNQPLALNTHDLDWVMAMEAKAEAEAEAVQES